MLSGSETLWFLYVVTDVLKKLVVLVFTVELNAIRM